jgi:phosphopantothenoylcysteine decarboxylase / phosphopantothenate---cysteine ligase
MGLALAEEALRRGADVTLVAANVALAPPPSARLIAVQTAAELAEACRAQAPACDVVLMAAAVADFRPRRPAATKLKKDQGPPEIELEPTEDVISAMAAQRRPGQLFVGFAAEHGAQAVEHARAKRERKGLDAVVVNDIAQPGIGFDVAENEVTIISRVGPDRRVAKAGKEQVAAAILDQVQVLWEDEERDDRAIRTDPDRTARV